MRDFLPLAIARDNFRQLENSISSLLNRKLSVLFLFSVLAGVACSPLIGVDWHASHEGTAILERVIALSYEINDGDIYPRWLSSAYYGQGLPFFNFYSPAFYLVTAYLHCLGLPLLVALKLVCWGLFLAGAWGMFVWVRKHCGNSGGVIAAILYMFAPYHFADIYVRGAMAEFAALAVLPYLFHGIDRALQADRQGKGIALLGFASALLLLTHNVSTLMIIGFALAYGAWPIFARRPAPRRVLAAALGPVIGAGLSAFYWLPLLIERAYLAPFEASLISNHPSTSYVRNFVFPSQWFAGDWGYGVSVLGAADGMSFQIGAVLLLFVVFATISIVFVSKQERQFGLAMLALAMFGLFMTTAYASFIYKAHIVFQFVQFPWRYLGPATLFLAAFAGLAARTSHGIKPIYLIVACVLLSPPLSAQQRSVSGELQLGPSMSDEYIIQQRAIGPLSIADEFLPKWASGQRTAVLQLRVRPESVETGKISFPASRLSFDTKVGDGGASIHIPQHYFPGWKASVDGARASVAPDNRGFLMIKVPKGEHLVEVWFGTTLSRMAGWGISLIAVGFIVALRMNWWRFRVRPKTQVR
ncbi:MAG: hypothetical protein R8K46_03105 [Mariprofundaceae bacterium]